MVDHHVLEKGWSKAQRMCPVCGVKWDMQPGKGSPCGHITEDNGILLPKVPDQPPFTD